LLPGYGNPSGALSEDVAAKWQPPTGIHIRWRGLWHWRSPEIVRRVRWDDSAPLDPRLIYYGLEGVADAGRAGRRPVLVYKPHSNPADKERTLTTATKYLSQVL